MLVVSMDIKNKDFIFIFPINFSIRDEMSKISICNWIRLRDRVHVDNVFDWQPMELGVMVHE